jgi:uncharacterized protein
MNTTTSVATNRPAQHTEFMRKYGPWAVVTGASDGIGQAFAEEIARRGVHVVLVARRADRLTALADRLGSEFQVQTRVLALDLSDSAASTTLTREIADIEVGLFVAAAGFGTSGNFVDSDLDAELNMLDVNCRRVLAQAHGISRRMSAQGRGGIVLLSSLVGFQGVPHAAHYSATKAWVQALAEGLHQELEPRGVHVIACAPGPVASGFAARAQMTMGKADMPSAVAAQTLNALGRSMTVRPGTMSKILGYSLSTAPRGLRVRIMQGIMGGMVGAK